MLTLEIKKPKRIQWFTINRVSHNLLGPAHTDWYSDGQKECEAYYLHDKLHRDPQLGPAHTYWYKDGQKYCESYYANGNKVSKP